MTVSISLFEYLAFLFFCNRRIDIGKRFNLQRCTTFILVFHNHFGNLMQEGCNSISGQIVHVYAKRA